MDIKKIAVVISILVGLSGLSGVAVKGYSHLAKASDLKLLAMRLDQKIAKDRINYVQERIWNLEDRYKGKEIPPEVLDIIRRLRLELKDSEKKFDQLLRKGS